MKRAYNRVGLSILVLYGVMALVSGIVTGLFAGIAMGLRLGPELESIMESGGQFDIQQIIDLIFGEETMSYLLPGMAVGSAAGMIVGVLLMKKVLPKDNCAPIPKRSLAAGDFLMIIFLAYGLWGAGALIGNMPEFFGVSVDQGILSGNGKGMIPMLIYSVIGAPILEELAFRKLLLDKVHPYGGTCAAFVSALLFGLMHGNSAQFLLAFCLGLLLATVYLYTGRVIYTIFLHFMINFTATIPNFFEFAGVDITVGWYIVVGSFALAGLIMLFFAKKNEALKLKLPYAEDANARTFHNVGMNICVFGGLVMIAVFEAMMLFTNFESGCGPVALVRLVPFGLTVFIVFAVRKTVGWNTQPMYESAPAQEPQYVPVYGYAPEPQYTPVPPYVPAEEAPIPEEAYSEPMPEEANPAPEEDPELETLPDYDTLAPEPDVQGEPEAPAPENVYPEEPENPVPGPETEE